MCCSPRPTTSKILYNEKKKTKNARAPELALAALAAHGVDLVDENYARGVLARLLEEIPDSPGPDPDEHLDEVGT